MMTIARKMDYWRSLLSIRPTGNTLVDDGLRDELRCALRDALHELEDGMAAAGQEIDRRLQLFSG